jgi:YD repeat-containing protein
VTTSYGYFPNGQVESVTTPDGTASYTYDRYGNVASTTDARGVMTEYT